MPNEALQNNALENTVNNDANAWQNMAVKVQETAKNLNKYEVGKRALRAAIVSLTATALFSSAFSREKNNHNGPFPEPSVIVEEKGFDKIVHSSEEDINEAASRMTSERADQNGNAQNELSISGIEPSGTTDNLSVNTKQ